MEHVPTFSYLSSHTTCFPCPNGGPAFCSHFSSSPASFYLSLPPSSASLSAQLGLQPGPPASPWWGLVLGSGVAWGDSERLECGKGGGGLGSGEPWGGHEGGFLLAGQSSATSLECRPLGHAKLMTSRYRNARCSVSSGGPPGGGCCAPNALNSLALPSPACPPSPVLAYSDSFAKPLISYLGLSDSRPQLFPYHGPPSPGPCFCSLGSSVHPATCYKASPEYVSCCLL